MPPIIFRGCNEKMVRPERIELPTSWFVAMHSIQLSYGRIVVESRLQIITEAESFRPTLRQQKVPSLPFFHHGGTESRRGTCGQNKPEGEGFAKQWRFTLPS